MASEQWVILELSSKADGEDPDLIRRSITYSIRGADVFIPAAVTQQGEDRVIHYLVEGYAFIRHDHAPQIYNRLENSKYVQAVVTKVSRTDRGRSVRELAFISSKDVEKMKRQIHVETDQGIGVGDTVLITSGAYKQIQAKVIEDIPEDDKVQVHVLLRSKDSIVSLPRSFLRLVEKAPKPPAVDRFSTLREWFNDCIDLIRASEAPTPTAAPIQKKFDLAHPLLSMGSRFERQTSLVWALIKDLNASSLQKKAEGALRLTNLAGRWGALSSMVMGTEAPALKSVEDRYLKLMTILSFTDQVEELEESLLDLEDKMEIKGPMVQNVVVDGLNVAFRCLYAPGMSEMRDMHGRPTGVLFGFIRVLMSLTKKYPGAALYVTWDGSSRTRKAKFAGYKANREPSQISAEDGNGNPWDQVAWLRAVLPLLGVTQVYNPQEEADDVIATLVRGRLKGQQNVFMSTDRDLLQLVSETDRFLVPSQGKRREALYDVAKVTEEWGVAPDNIVSLRALLGDSSDNIPGVPTVPQKVLTELLQLYRSIDSIYRSNLAGLTKLRYKCLREAELQVRLNLDLMTLRDVPLTDIAPNPDQTAAVERLTDVDVQVEPILAAFFGVASQAVEPRVSA